MTKLDMTKGIITFDKDSAMEILSMFGMSVDSDGFVCEKNGKRVFGAHGETVLLDDFIGFRRVDGKATIVARDEIFDLVDIIAGGKSVDASEEDMDAYELIADTPINVSEVSEKWESGEGKFWMVCIEDRFRGICRENEKHDDGMIRFRGVFMPGDGRPWVRIFIDISRNVVYVNAPSGQRMSKLEIAREVQKEIGGTLYKNGEKV
jgi:hypothetical protein